MYIEKAKALASMTSDASPKLPPKFSSLQDLEPLLEIFTGRSTSLADKAAIIE